MKLLSPLLVTCMVLPSLAFTPSWLKCSRFCNMAPLFTIFDNEETKSENEFDGFNPFNRKETKSPQRAAQILSSTISLRQMRMKELMGNLVLADESEINRILGENEDLLMEPLLDDDAVMDEDSIYDRGMTRDERFDRYEEVMLERESKAVNGNVQRILSAMRVFVMSRRI